MAGNVYGPAYSGFSQGAGYALGPNGAYSQPAFYPSASTPVKEERHLRSGGKSLQLTTSDAVGNIRMASGSPRHEIGVEMRLSGAYDFPGLNGSTHWVGLLVKSNTNGEVVASGRILGGPYGNRDLGGLTVKFSSSGQITKATMNGLEFS